jgi:hypothetical protein
LVHLVTDYGPGDLAFAEVVQRAMLAVPDAVLLSTRVAPFDTLAAGFCVGELLLCQGPPGRVVVHDVAPRENDATGAANDGRRFCAGHTVAGAVALGPNAGWSWSFTVDELSALHYLDVPKGESRLESRELIVTALAHVAAGHPHAVREVVPRSAIPPLPGRVVAYVDCFGNMKTTITQPPVPHGDRVLVRIGDVSATALVADGSTPAAEGELTLTREPVGSRYLELSMPGGSAAERFATPAAGTPIALAPADV